MTRPRRLVPALLPLALAACASAPPPPAAVALTAPPPAAPPPAAAFVRVIHASPDTFAQTVQAYLDNGATPAVPDLTFKSAAGYTPIPAGVHSVQARVPGMSAATPAPINWNTPDLQPGRAYTIVAHGLASDLSGPQVTFSHDEDAMTAAPAGRANVRFFHALVGGGTVDVCLNGGTPAFAAVSYGTFANAAGVPGHYAGVAPGTVSVAFRGSAAGRPPCTGRVVGTVDVPLVDGSTVTLVAVGRLARPPLAVAPEVLVCTDGAPQPSRCSPLAVRAGR
jgi:hypothetical protein